MKKHILLTATILLSACFGGADESVLDTTRTAQSGMRTSAEMVTEEEQEPPTPAAIAGVLAGMHVSGAKKSESLIPDPLDPAIGDTGTEAHTELLNTLVKLLGTDIQILLNSASDREDALDLYVESIESHAQHGHILLRAMRDDVEEHGDDKKRYERRVRDIRNEIEDAISEGDTNRVSILTDELIQKQQALAEADSSLIVKEHLSEAYEDVLTPIDDRLKAINANRQALIKGVKVIDMPGVEELEIIEYEDGKVRVRGRNRGWF